MNYEQARFNMIEQQIRPWEVLDTHVLSLLALVKREDFVPAGHQALAFADLEIPLSNQADNDPGQCMLSPKVEARILQDLAVQKHEKVLEIGAGSGNAEVRCADGAALVSNPESALALGGPFDVIVLSGSVASVPPQLLALLKMGGRLSAIVGDEPVMRATLITRVGDAAWHTTQAWDTVAPRLLNFAEPSRFQF